MIKSQGVPFTVSVQARSALLMRTDISQTSRRPGAPGQVRATLTDSGIPLDHSTVVVARTTEPDGSRRIIPMHRTEPGTYTATIRTAQPGVYQVLVSAVGSDLRGTPFTREELRTLAVWSRGDDAPPFTIDLTSGGGTHLDLCGLLNCLLQDDGLRKLLERHEVNPDTVQRCARNACG